MPNATVHPGECSSFTIRLVVAPSTGLFRLTALAFPGAFVEEGQAIGEVTNAGSVCTVRAATSGRLMEVLASDGERIRREQAVAWMTVE